MLDQATHLLSDAPAIAERQDDALKFGARHQSFYKGDKEENRAASPYLFELRADTPFADWYFQNGWGRSWGVPVCSSAPFDEVYRHFRRFLMVKTEDGERLYFRFYDPRVLRIFLPTCDAAQIREFFGTAIDYFICEDEDPDYALRFSHQYGLLQTERFSVKDEIAALPEPEPLPATSTEDVLPPETIAALKEQGKLEEVLAALGMQQSGAPQQAKPVAQPISTEPVERPKETSANPDKPKTKWNMFD